MQGLVAGSKTGLMEVVEGVHAASRNCYQRLFLEKSQPESGRVEITFTFQAGLFSEG